MQLTNPKTGERCEDFNPYTDPKPPEFYRQYLPDLPGVELIYDIHLRMGKSALDAYGEALAAVVRASLGKQP